MDFIPIAPASKKVIAIPASEWNIVMRILVNQPTAIDPNHWFKALTWKEAGWVR